MASAPKIMKVKHSDANGKGDQEKGFHEAVEKIDEVQNEIDKLNEKASEEILQVEQQFNKKRQPFYKQRAELIGTIAKFWLTALKNHPQISAYICPEDELVLQHLKNLDVEEFEDIKSGFKITLTFSPNEYFTNSSLTKGFHVGEPDLRTVCETINWQTGKNLVEKIEERRKAAGGTGSGQKRGRSSGPISFIQWFSLGQSNSLDEIGEVIKDDLWPNPLQYYLAGEGDDGHDDDDELDDEDDFAGDDDDDEEGEEEAEVDDEGEGDDE